MPAALLLFGVVVVAAGGGGKANKGAQPLLAPSHVIGDVARAGGVGGQLGKGR